MMNCFLVFALITGTEIDAWKTHLRHIQVELNLTIEIARISCSLKYLQYELSL